MDEDDSPGKDPERGQIDLAKGLRDLQREGPVDRREWQDELRRALQTLKSEGYYTVAFQTEWRLAASGCNSCFWLMLLSGCFAMPLLILPVLIAPGYLLVSLFNGIISLVYFRQLDRHYSSSMFIDDPVRTREMLSQRTAATVAAPRQIDHPQRQWRGGKS